MDIRTYVRKLKELGIETITGVPDSTLQVFCGFIGEEDSFPCHITAANEGAAIGIAIGEYLATGKPACVYMQNSGLGNTVNPLTSLAHTDVYGIPVLLMVGWRGEPGTKDEPQHKYMGKITPDLLEVLGIRYSVITGDTTEEELEKAFRNAKEDLLKNRQYALVIRKGAFQKTDGAGYKNDFILGREEAVSEIAGWLEERDLVVSTTGKISREMYEQSDRKIGDHRQTFLTVGGMGHANMIACQIAKRLPERRIICLDGDGALLMHMGNMAVVGEQNPGNLVHICLNNRAHESVGGMPTGAPGLKFCEMAEAAGYRKVFCVKDKEGLREKLSNIRGEQTLTFLEIMVSLGAREDLGRPKETAEENKKSFMKKIADY
ncbi:MAG: phosphonopyruvate decarboxylase [Lachnospiraceae bacterium]|nr:phosphonopyruvate decarboxylase [Lachnospiraceae bacterium]